MTHDHDPDFTNPKLNGAQPMSDAETIAEVLAAHQIERGHRDTRAHCLCGWKSAPGLPFRADAHLAHVDAALEPVIREREKAAWESGVNTGIGYKTAMDFMGDAAPPPTNPYDTKEEA